VKFRPQLVNEPVHRSQTTAVPAGDTAGDVSKSLDELKFTSGGPGAEILPTMMSPLPVFKLIDAIASPPSAVANTM
jgi:hypothetical protein